MEQWLTFLRGNFHHLDNSSQELIYHSFRELIYRDICLLFRNHALAEDVVQESFIKIVEQAPKLRNTTNMKAWIKKVARNTAYDYLKKIKNIVMFRTCSSLRKVNSLPHPYKLRYPNRWKNKFVTKCSMKLSTS